MKEKFIHTFILKNDPKARRPNKMTRSRTHKNKKVMRNISDFENVPKRGWLLVGNGLESNEVDFEGDAGPDREQMETTKHLCDAVIDISGRKLKNYFPE